MPTKENPSNSPSESQPIHPTNKGDPLHEQDFVVRFINPKAHLKPSGELSSGAFSPAKKDGGTSVEVESLLLRDGIAPLQRVETISNASLGAIRLSVQSITQQVVVDTNTDEERRLSVVYDPLEESDQGGPNPYHANIIGTKSGALRKRLVEETGWTWVKQVFNATDESK